MQRPVHLFLILQFLIAHNIAVFENIWTKSCKLLNQGKTVWSGDEFALQMKSAQISLLFVPRLRYEGIHQQLMIQAISHIG